jgi:hypothetical protein
MRRTVRFLIGCVILSAVMASAQSLGDYAKNVRKDKGQPSSTSRHFDNDNLPKSDHLTVMGQPATAEVAKTEESKSDNGDPEKSRAEAAKEPETPKDSSTASDEKAPSMKAKEKDRDEDAERQKAWNEWKKRLQAQKNEIATLEKDLDLTNREYRLRAAAMYADAGNRLRNAGSWDKEDRDYKAQIAQKEKAVEEAKSKLESMKEDARREGVPSSMRE